MKVLFFTPYAHRNGAEIMLKYMLQNINKDQFKTKLYAGAKGELLSDYSKNTQCYYNKYSTGIGYYLNKFSHSIFKNDLSKKQIINIHKKFKPDVWYINTFNMPFLMDIAEELAVKTIVHFHENPFQYQLITKTDLMKIVKRADLLIGCSDYVVDGLKILADGPIVKFNEVLNIEEIKVFNKRALRTELNLDDSTFIWGMSGVADFRKGIDLIPEILKKVDKENMAICWLGGESNYGTFYYAQRKIKRYGIKNFYSLGIKRHDYFDYLAGIDGFLLTSRYDSFPLVMIEAAYLKKPIVSLNSGGISEFLTDGMGLIAQDHSIEQIAKNMQLVMSGEFKYDGDKARKRAKEFDVKKKTKEFETILMNL